MIFSLDTVAPAVAITSGGKLTNQAAQTISGTGEVGTTVQLLDGATALGSAVTVDGTGHWSTSVTLSGDRAHSLTARDTDAVGNVGTSAAVVIDLKTTPPTLTWDAQTRYVNDPIITIHGTGLAGAVLNVSDPVHNRPDYSVTVGADGTWSTTFDISVNGDYNGPNIRAIGQQGTYVIDVTETDGYGNQNRLEAAWILDTTPPPITLDATITPALLQSFTSLYTFAYPSPLGQFPQGTLAHDNSGNFLFIANHAIDLLDPTTLLLSSIPASYSPSETGYVGGLSAVMDAQGNIFGVSQFGGGAEPYPDSGYGTVWELPVGSSHTVLIHRFTNTGDTDYPLNLAADGDGNMFGTTVGGFNEVGGVFMIDGQTHQFSLVHDFRTGGGRNAFYAMTQDAQGNLIGATSIGGQFDCGVVYEIERGTHAFSILHTFNGSDGYGLSGSPVLDAAGNIYGVSTGGGANGKGTLWQIDATTHNATVLYDFTSAINPQGKLVLDGQGHIFGLSQLGGTANLGTLWEYTIATHTLTTLHSFTGADGAQPSVMFMNSPGHLVGFTAVGGANEYGTMWRFDLTPAVAGANQANEVLTGTTEAGTSVAIYDGTTLVGQGSVAADGSWTSTVTLNGQGVHTLYATSTDEAGNVTNSVARTFTIDTIAPVVAITTAGGPTNQASKLISGTVDLSASGFGDGGSTVAVKAGANTLGTATVDATTGAWSVTVNLGADGDYTLTAQDTDSYGNTGTSAAVVVTLDTVAPVAAITSAGGLTNLAARTVVGTGEAGTTVQLLDGGSALGSAATVDGTGHWSISVALVGEGAHSLTVRDTDAAGNAATSGAVGYTLDTVAPALAVTSAAGGVTTHASQTIAGTAEVGASVQLFDNGIAVGSAVTVGADGAWSFNATLVEGSNVFKARAADAAGNLTNASGPSFQLDTTPPALVITSAGGATTSRTQVISGTVGAADAGMLVKVFDDGVLLGSATADGTGQWSLAVDLPKLGSQVITASTADALGNAITTAGLTLNYAAPAIPAVVPGAYTIGGNVILGDTAFAGVTGMTSLTLNGSGPSDLTLGSNAAAAFGNAVVVKTGPGVTHLNLDGSALVAPATLTAYGTAGSDSITGGSGNDVFFGGGGADSLAGGVGTDIFVFNSLADFTAAGRVVDGGAGYDGLNLGFSGTIGDSVFTGVTNMEQVALVGTGAAALTLGSAASAAFGASAVVRADASVTSLVVNGSGLGSTTLDVQGSSGADSLVGTGGSDIFRSSGGADSMLGGAGNDTFIFNALADFTAAGKSVDGGAGADGINLGFSGAIADSAFAGVTNMEQIYLFGAGATALTLGSAASAAFGASVTVRADASVTSLVVNGSGLGTTALDVQGSSGADSLVGGGGSDIFRSSGGADSMLGGAGNDAFIFSTLADFTAAGRIADGGVGSDNLKLGFAGAVADSAFSGISNMEQLTLTGTGASSLVLGAAASAAFAGNVVIRANAGVTSLSADASAFTAAQKVNVTGGAGNDTFIGGAGNDTFIAGGGFDLFVLNAGGNDQITGFDTAHDVLSLVGWAVHSFAGLSPFIHASGTSTVISVDASHGVTLKNMAPASLGAADFLFS